MEEETGLGRSFALGASSAVGPAGELDQLESSSLGPTGAPGAQLQGTVYVWKCGTELPVFLKRSCK